MQAKYFCCLTDGEKVWSDKEAKRKRCSVTKRNDRETDNNSNGRESEREMLSFLRHGWGSTAAGTLFLQIQSDLQLNQPWHSGYRAGRDQTHGATQWSIRRKVWKVGENGGKEADTVAGGGNYMWCWHSGYGNDPPLEWLHGANKN